MKKTILMLLVSILIMCPFAIADLGMDSITTHVTTPRKPEVEIPEEIEEGAGITPINPLWGLERAIERISLALTFGKSAKAKKGLAHARERLMEVQAMIAVKRLGAAAEAQEAHDEIMEEVEGNIEELGDNGIVEELEDQVELEQTLNEHRNLVQTVGNFRLKVKGLSSEQQAQLNAVVESLQSSTSKVEIEVKIKKDKTKIKIKAKDDYMDEEIAQIEEDIKSAIASEKEVDVVLPGRGKEKNKVMKNESEDAEEVEDDGDEEAGVTAGKGKQGKEKSEKENKGKGKNK